MRSVPVVPGASSTSAEVLSAETDAMMPDPVSSELTLARLAMIVEEGTHGQLLALGGPCTRGCINDSFGTRIARCRPSCLALSFPHAATTSIE